MTDFDDKIIAELDQELDNSVNASVSETFQELASERHGNVELLLYAVALVSTAPAADFEEQQVFVSDESIERARSVAHYFRSVALGGGVDGLNGVILALLEIADLHSDDDDPDPDQDL